MVRPGTNIRLVFLFVALAVAGSLPGGLVLGQAVNSLPQADPDRTITARAGDTVRKIAKRAGVSATKLARLNNLAETSRVPKGTKLQLPSETSETPTPQTDGVGNRITLADGFTFEADEVWKQGDEIWFRKGNITRVLNKSVKSVSPVVKNPGEPVPTPSTAAAAKEKTEPLPTWIYLVDGARFRVDAVQETAVGAWYSRNNISIFLERERIARIEVEQPRPAGGEWRGSDWTSGNSSIDSLIRTNGARFGVDPYLVFLVIEKESRFKTRAVSPKGARGLMQLMPATARRLGVRNSFDPAENIRGGTQYLRELMDMFGGQVNLVLASYNAGEGAVLKYGRNVPPYRETRDYVKTIGKRYGLAGRERVADGPTPPPQR